jgi:hypothetical protein
MIREEILDAAAAAEGREAKLAVMRDWVQAAVLRSFHESGAFLSVCLAGQAARHFGDGSPNAAQDLEFILVGKKGYGPEKWLFKAKRYLGFSGLDVRIAFARRGNLHSGWVKVSGLLDGEDLGFRILVDAAPAELPVSRTKIVEAAGQCFGIRYTS